MDVLSLRLPAVFSIYMGHALRVNYSVCSRIPEMIINQLANRWQHLTVSAIYYIPPRFISLRKGDLQFTGEDVDFQGKGPYQNLIKWRTNFGKSTHKLDCV